MIWAFLACGGCTSPAEHSTAGIVLAATSLVIMPILFYAQRRAGRELGSASAVADSKDAWPHPEPK